MADGPKDYRDPKVTTTDTNRGGSMKWLWVLLALIVLALLIWWFWPTEGAVVVEEPEADAIVVDPVE